MFPFVDQGDKMIIIVEGIDRVGKTTLCNKLNEKLGIKIFKHDEKIFDYKMMDNENETDKMIQLIEICKMFDLDIIFDRFHWSDFVYGILNRNYDIDSALANLEKIESMLKKHAIVIYIQPADIKRSEREHGEKLDKNESMFRRLFYIISSCKKIVCDYNTIDCAVKRVEELIKNDRI